MITRALDAGTPAAWVTADEVYGQDPKLRAELARRLPVRAWQRMSAGPGAEGPAGTTGL